MYPTHLELKSGCLIRIREGEEGGGGGGEWMWSCEWLSENSSCNARESAPIYDRNRPYGPWEGLWRVLRALEGPTSLCEGVGKARAAGWV